MAVSFSSLNAGQNITINDTIWDSTYNNPGPASGQGLEDNQTEKTANGTNTITTQSWDFEGIFWNDVTSTLTIIGGIDFINGVQHAGNDSEVGDLFLGHWTGDTFSPSGANVYAADYALDFTRQDITPDNDDPVGNPVGNLPGGTFDIFEGPFSVENTTDVDPLSDPWLYNGNGILYGTGDYTAGTVEDSPFNAWRGDDTHNYLQITGLEEIAWLIDEGAILHQTLQCGNDVLKGSAPIPEPATMLLFGTGLIGLAGLGRKKFRKS